MTTVVRNVEEALGERLGRDHLAASRHDQPLERPEEPARIAVGRDDHGLGVELRELGHPLSLDDLCSSPSSPLGETPDEARRLECRIRRMADRSGEASREHAARLVDPLGVEPVRPERLDLVAQVLALLAVDREPQAADLPERIAAELPQRA